MLEDETTAPVPTVDQPSNSTPLYASRGRNGLTIWLSACLVLCALANVIFWVVLAVDKADTEVSESPLMLAIARQLIVGPTQLYGPYIDGHRLVLIHPPFYYNLATLLAWPLARLGCDNILAALIAGRSLSFLSFLLLLPVVYRLTRLDGARPLTGVWAVLLVAGTPILGGMPFTIRPDMLGVLFQTTGILFALTALRGDRPRPGLLYAAFAAFGLAVCVKQHLVAGPAVTLLLLLRARWRGRVPSRVIERSLLLMMLIVGGIYGAEELITQGRMSEAVLNVAGAIRRIQPAGLSRTILVGMVSANKTYAMILTFVAAMAGLCLGDSGRVRRFVGCVGLVAMAAYLAMFSSQIYQQNVTLDAVLVLCIVPLVLLVLAARAGRSRRNAARVDAEIWLYIVAEFAVIVPLWWLSTGAWFNYTIPAAILFAVLVARTAERAVDRLSPGFWVRVPLALAGLAGLAALTVDLESVYGKRALADLAIKMTLEQLKRKPSEIYFVDRPGFNRLYGRVDLVHDTWLYPIFEATRLAEARSIWLGRALAAGPVRVVINSSDKIRIDGVTPTLFEMGFGPDINVGPVYVWIR